MTDRKPVLTGGCQCGAVRYALYAQPENVHICHCRMCQKAVGGPFAHWARVRRKDFAWTRGAPAAFRSSSLSLRVFCAACGTPLSIHDIDGPWIWPTGGSLDRPDLAPPAKQYGVESRVPWWGDLSGLPGESTEADDTEGKLKGMVRFQHPDHDTPPDWRPPQG